MRHEAWQRLDLVARNILPFFATLLLILVGMAPLRLPGLSPAAPSLALIAVYYWSVYRPNLMPVWAVFLVGLFHDLLVTDPMGIGILTLLLLYGLVENLRRYMLGAGFLAVWLVFVLVAAVASFVAWTLVSLLEGQAAHADPVFFRYLATIALYPCVAWLFGQVQRSLVR